MKTEDVQNFERLSGKLDGFHKELSILAKKAPNDAINKFKMNLLNNTLLECNTLLGPTYRPFSDFEQFEVESIPTTSDVTLVLAQYIECAERFRSDNITGFDEFWHWKTSDGSKIQTSRPRKLTNG